MKNQKLQKTLTYVMKPMSWLYGCVTGMRNWMFNQGILPQVEYDVPIVTVGNITVGGTGKTPHVEYILNRMSADHKIAVLSRGYKRKTRGFILANTHSTPETIGDEPLQIFRKFGSRVKVAVCENRRKGIKELLKQFPDLEMIVLDDGFQHRFVKPKVGVLLMDYSRPIYEDHLLPWGRLRENPHQMNRADMVIVTKCPEDIQPIDYRLVSKHLDLMSFQKLYFSHFNYGALEPVYADESPYHVSLRSLTERDAVLIITGIANPRSFIRHFKQYEVRPKVLHFADHHDYTREDMQQIRAKFLALSGERKIIVTTEKDAMRLMYNPYFPDDLKQVIYYLPISVKMDAGIDDSDFISDLRKAIEAPST